MKAQLPFSSHGIPTAQSAMLSPASKTAVSTDMLNWNEPTPRIRSGAVKVVSISR